MFAKFFAAVVVLVAAVGFADAREAGRGKCCKKLAHCCTGIKHCCVVK